MADQEDSCEVKISDDCETEEVTSGCKVETNIVNEDNVTDDSNTEVKMSDPITTKSNDNALIPEEDKAKCGSAPMPGDEYAYVNRGEFTSEAFKVEIKNLPKHISHAQIKKMLQSLNVAPRKVKYTPQSTFAFIALRSEEEQQKAINSITDHIWKKSKLFAKKARPKADPVLRKRRGDDEVSGGNCKQQKVEIQSGTPAERVAKAVAPLHAMPYDAQLELKSNAMVEVLRRVGRQLTSSQSGQWVKDNCKLYGGMCCSLLPIKASPVQDFYRNKVEFNVGPYPETLESAVGFKLGNYREGNCHVAEPTECRNVTPEAKAIAKMFQSFIPSSIHNGYDPVTHKGVWRQLTVRTCTTKEIMVIVQIHCQGLTQEVIDGLKNELRDVFSQESCPTKVTSLYLESHKPSTSDSIVSEMPLELLQGETCIHENLFDMQFRISPRAFFQVNTPAAEVLYSLVKDWCNPKPTTTVLDVCCGTGTIGLYLAKAGAKRVYGIEMCQQAIDDAEENAKRNGIENATFICGKAEDVFSDLVKQLWKEDDVIAIVDPPRAGLHNRVVQTIRRCHKISRMIYVSCNPKAASANFVDFCRPPTKRIKGLAFKMVQSVPVDLFPHTEHCELVTLFTRGGPLPCKPPSQVPDEGASHTKTASSPSPSSTLEI